MESNIVHNLDRSERVTSSYAEIYLNDDFCDYTKPLVTNAAKEPKRKLNIKSGITNELVTDDEWTSPSDHLIGIIELKPPLTSKITRGITHAGILAIGNEVLKKEYEKFMTHVTTLLHDNDSAWRRILKHETVSVKKKVNEIYGKILMEKSKIMKQEANTFYETTLQELEVNLKTQVDDILISAHANIVSDLNTEIKQKLEKERIELEGVLKKQYDAEVVKLKHYYKLLLHNEIYRYKKLVNQAINGRNDALKAFYRQIEAENMTSTMYILCLERKKCRIKQFILENYQNLEISEKNLKIKNRQDVIAAFQEKDVKVSDLNKAWEEKIKKVLHIFLKFVSFSLKLLPEQTTFLLDLEKMVVLQLNEIQKTPEKALSIIVDEEEINNIFKFEQLEKEANTCTDEPFVIVGDLSDPIPPQYGSRETLPSDVDLPVTRLQRQYVYAKCHGYEHIKTLLENNTCKCSYQPPKQQSQESVLSSPNEEEPILVSEKASSDEFLLLDDIQRLHECPVRRCKDWAQHCTFPVLDSYLDFSEENYKRVKAVLGNIPQNVSPLKLIDPKRMGFEVQFSATNELYHTVETQYSSQEDLYLPDIECPCKSDAVPIKPKESSVNIKESSDNLNQILAKRKLSLRFILQQNPNLLKMFTDESFDFVL